MACSCGCEHPGPPVAVTVDPESSVTARIGAEHLGARVILTFLTPEQVPAAVYVPQKAARRLRDQLNGLFSGEFPSDVPGLEDAVSEGER